MVGSSRPLPAPPFPVYGLRPDYAGPRRLQFWSEFGGRLWHVDLAHGHGDFTQGPSLVTITDAKLPANHPHGGTGLEDAALGALLYLHHAQGIRIERSGGTRSMMNAAELAELSRQLDGIHWTTESAAVGGTVMEWRQYRVADAWAAVVDVGPVAVGAFGKKVDLRECSFDTVNDELSTYRGLEA